MTYEYAHVSEGVIGQKEVLPAELPSDHPKILSSALIRVVEAPFDYALNVPTGEVSETVVNGEVVRAYVGRNKNGDEIAVMKAAKHADIEAEFQRLYCEPIAFTVGGEQYTFHADDEARENITGVLMAYREAADLGLTLPDPRPWTPMGQAAPISITRAELAALGIAIAARKDELFAIKKQKQAALAALTEPADIDAVDPADGWEN